LGCSQIPPLIRRYRAPRNTIDLLRLFEILNAPRAGGADMRKFSVKSRHNNCQTAKLAHAQAVLLFK
jgi:hypothetical protein